MYYLLCWPLRQSSHTWNTLCTLKTTSRHHRLVAGKILLDKIVWNRYAIVIRFFFNFNISRLKYRTSDNPTANTRVPLRSLPPRCDTQALTDRCRRRRYLEPHRSVDPVDSRWDSPPWARTRSSRADNSALRLLCATAILYCYDNSYSEK